MFTRVDVIAQNDDLWSFEFADDQELENFLFLCKLEGYKIQNVEIISQQRPWLAQEAFDCIQENS